MELCLDNPREGFADLFATHPSIQSRCAKLVQFAGGHDPGPLALPMHADPQPPELPSSAEPDSAPPPLPGPPADAGQGPWGAHDPTRPFGP
jgi:heat shock protein HtpX